MSSAGKKRSFEHSQELKRLFNKHFEVWSKKNHAGFRELAECCGVSAQYLAHIGRYGRIPGKPILILLALNFGLGDPRELLRAAGIKDPWPYDPEIGLRPKGATESGFLSLNIDMAGFTSAIREIVRSEIKPRSLEELLSGRSLRVGLNYGQFFLFGETKGGPSKATGFFPELMQLMSLALHVNLEFREVPHTGFSDALRSGEIDVYGPIYYTAPRIGQALFSDPFCRVLMGAVWRKKSCTGLEELPPPKKIADLRKKDYRIAVHAEAMSHHFALGDLDIPEERLIPCEVLEETFERILMSKIPRPAHLLLTDAPSAYRIQKEHSREMQLVLTEKSTDLASYEDTIAVRPDWPVVVDLFNEVIEFLSRNGSLERVYQRTIDSSETPGILIG